MEKSEQPCELCTGQGGVVIRSAADWRIVLVDDPDYPGFCRVIWNAHVREMSDLPAVDRQRLMAVVLAVEEAVRMVYRPDKINLASFGNVVPHLHWHVIPRWRDDRHFPQPIWGVVQREVADQGRAVPAETLVNALNQTLGDMN